MAGEHSHGANGEPHCDAVPKGFGVIAEARDFTKEIDATVVGADIKIAKAVFKTRWDCKGKLLRGKEMVGMKIGHGGVDAFEIFPRKVRAKMSLILYIFLVYGVSAIILNILMFASKQSPLGYSTSAYGWIFLLAVIPQLIGHSLFNWLLKYLSATMVSVTTLSEPIGSAILAFIFLKETPTLAVIGGGVLILVGIYLTSKQSY